MKGDQLYLRHILDAIEKIEIYVAVGRDVFLATSHWQDAVVRQLEIIGEATKRLSKVLCSQHKDVPWRRIAGLRDVLIHDYMGVDVKRGVGNHPEELADFKDSNRRNFERTRKVATQIWLPIAIAILPQSCVLDQQIA